MDEDIAIPLIVFSFVLSLIWMILSHSKWKYRQKMESREASGNSLRTSELKDLMREAVEEATGPLKDHIKLLEAQVREMRTPRLMPAQKEELLEELEEKQEERLESARRRVT